MRIKRNPSRPKGIFHRKWKDSVGHRAEIILFSEFRDTGHTDPTPEDIVSSIFRATPGMTGGGKSSRYNQDIKRKYLSALRFAISMLSKKQKRVIFLKFYLNLKNSEIAEKLGISRQGVQDLLNHATENMRNFLIKGKTTNQTRVRLDKLANIGRVKQKVLRR